MFNDTEVSFLFFNIPITFFILCFIYLLIYQNFIKCSYSNTLLLLIGGIYLLSLFWGGLTNAFHANILYITSLLPLLLFLFASSSYASFGQQHSYYVLMGMIFVGLVIFYNNNLGHNILSEIESQNMGSYTLLFFLPIILCFPKRIYRIAGLFVIFIAILISLKRGGLVSLTISTIIYFLIYNYSYQQKKVRLLILFLSIIMITALFFLYDYIDVLLNGMISERLDSIQTDEGSGRLEIYKNVFNMIIESSPSNLIWGHGWYAVFKDSSLEVSAHNDFLEVLYDFGLIIFVIYLKFYYKLLKHTITLMKKKSFYAAPLGTSVSLFFINSMVSHVLIYPQYFMILCFFWGIIAATNRNVITYKIYNNNEDNNACLWHPARGY